MVNTQECPKAIRFADYIISPLYGSKEGEGKRVLAVMKPSVQIMHLRNLLKRQTRVYLHVRMVTDKPHTKN